jgi:polar amino acid transport system substrate-binding protein
MILVRNVPLLLLIMAALCGRASPVKADMEQTLVVLVADAVPPKMFLADGKPTGFVTEIACEAVRRAGYRPDVKALPFARALAVAQAGGGIIPGLSFSEERAQLFLFSGVMYEDPVLLVTASDRDFPYHGLQDLAGRHIGINRGSHYGAALDAARQTFSVEEDSGTEPRLRKLLLGHLDGAIVSGGAAAVRFTARAIGTDPSTFVIHRPPLALDKNFIGVAKGMPDAQLMIDRLNGALASMWADGTIARMVAAYE